MSAGNDSYIYPNLWLDTFGSFDMGSGASSLTREQYRAVQMVRPSGAQSFMMYFLRHDQDDFIIQRYQINHNWNPGTQVHVHVHTVPMSTWVPGAPTKNVYWGIKYFMVPLGVAIPDDAGWSAVVNSTQTLAPADQYLHKYHELGIIPLPASPTVSTMLLLMVSRLGTDGSDTYNDDKGSGTGAANLGLLDIDVHFQVNKPGSSEETSF